MIGISNECSNTYSVNDELGSNKLGLFLLLETGTTARGENFLGSIMRGEAGLTVLGDGLRDDCFDIGAFYCVGTDEMLSLIGLYPRLLVSILFLSRHRQQ